MSVVLTYQHQQRRVGVVQVFRTFCHQAKFTELPQITKLSVRIKLPPQVTMQSRWVLSYGLINEHLELGYKDLAWYGDYFRCESSILSPCYARCVDKNDRLTFKPGSTSATPSLNFENNVHIHG